MSHILLKRNRFLKKFIIFGDFHQNGKNQNEEEEEEAAEVEERERENSSVFLFIYIDRPISMYAIIISGMHFKTTQKIRTSRGRQVSKYPLS